MKYFKKLVGERIYLSPRNAEDVEQFTEWMNDFEVTDYIGRTSQMISLSGEKEFLEKNANPESTFVIVDLKDDVMVGTVSLEKINRVDSKATLGIFIGRSEYRSKGYGAEAINLILDFGFNYMNLNSINLTVLDCNERAKACYKKCGFKETGRERQGKFVNGKYYDAIMMDILREEFKGRDESGAGWQRGLVVWNRRAGCQDVYWRNGSCRKRLGV